MLLLNHRLLAALRKPQSPSGPGIASQGLLNWGGVGWCVVSGIEVAGWS